MVGEVLAGLSTFKVMLDAVKTIKTVNDTVVRNTAIVELTEHIITAQAAQSDLIQEVRELEAKVASFEKWEADKERYELKNVGFQALAYVLKPDARGTHPPHWACTNCYGQGKISILQYMMLKKGQGFGSDWCCPSCGMAIHPGSGTCTWPAHSN